MQRANPPQFRPTLTLWATDVAGLPGVRPIPTYPAIDWFAPPQLRHLPEDFAFQECLDLDIHDDDAVTDFVRNWGSFAPDLGRQPGAGLPANGLTEWRALKETDLAGDDPLGGKAPIPNHDLSGQRLYLVALRACAEHYLARGSSEPLASAWSRHGFECADRTDRQPWIYFVTLMNGALQAFPPLLLLDGRDLSEGRIIPSTYEVAMLQLVLAITQNRVVRTCANVRCGKPFTRQRGRAKYPGNEHQRGVKYCSANCAKAQSERERRARRRLAPDTNTEE